MSPTGGFPLDTPNLLSPRDAPKPKGSKITGPLSTLFWLALLRIYAGLYWAAHAIIKVANPAFGTTDGYFGTVLNDAIANSRGNYHDWLIGSVSPHIALLSTTLSYAEILLALMLLVGLAGRFAAFALLVMGALYWFGAEYFLIVSQYIGREAVGLVLAFFCMVLPTTAYLSIDAWISLKHARKAIS